MTRKRFGGSRPVDEPGPGGDRKRVTGASSCSEHGAWFVSRAARMPPCRPGSYLTPTPLLLPQAAFSRVAACQRGLALPDLKGFYYNRSYARQRVQSASKSTHISARSPSLTFSDRNDKNKNPLCLVVAPPLSVPRALSPPYRRPRSLSRGLPLDHLSLGTRATCAPGRAPLKNHPDLTVERNLMTRRIR